MDCHALDPIAIIGRGCRLPGASNIREYWELIREDRSTTVEIPDSRLDRELLFDPVPGTPHRTYCSKACLIEPVGGQDLVHLPVRWRTHPESVFRDLISVTRDACADAGRELEGWTGARGGVFLGHTRGGSLAGDLAYASYVAQAAELLDELGEFLTPTSRQKIESWKNELVSEVRRDMPTRHARGDYPLGASVGALAVADSLSWDGPYMAFNGACASSLQALHAAVKSLQSHRVDIAVAAGASCFHTDSLILFAQARSLSPHDTRPFDDDADGLIIGEGCVVLILKRLADAIRDNDSVHGVVRGIGVASDGKGKSLWAPRKEGQIKAIGRAYASPADMAKIQYVEAHATSTQLGDATEMEALSEAFGEVFHARKRIPVGSVKGNIGHTLETAGLAGVLKTILCMESKTIPAHHRLSKLSTKILWDSIPFHVPREVSPWTEDEMGQRWAAINGFGIGGLNAHVVLQSGVVPEAQASMPKCHTSMHALQANVSKKSVASHRARSPEIAILSAGCILPGALSWQQFRDVMRNGASQLRSLPKDRWISGPRNARTSTDTMASTYGGFVDDFVYDWRRHKVPPKQIAAASPLQFMILEAVDQALGKARIADNADYRARSGVVVGTIFGGDFSNQLQMGLRIPDLRVRLARLWSQAGIDEKTIHSMLERFVERLLAKMPALFDETGSFTSSSLASRITKTFDLMGGAVAVDAGHGSSGAALAYCIDQLNHNENQFMLCIGAQQDLGPMKFEGWTKNDWLSHSPASSALQEHPVGVFPGEGAGVMLLQRIDRHHPPVAPPLGFIRGIGSSYGRFGDTVVRNAVANCFQQCDPNETPASIQSIRLSPMGSEQIESHFFEGLAEAIGSGMREVKTAVDQLGHLSGGAGMVECLASLATAPSKKDDRHPRATHLAASRWAWQSDAEYQRELVCIGSPWECVYSVLLDISKE